MDNHSRKGIEMTTKKPVAKKDIEVLTGEIVLAREAPMQRIMDVKDILQSALNAAQLRMLTGQTPKWAIKTRQGRGGKAFKYVPHGYVTDTLNKAFGYDWDLVFDQIEDGKLYSFVEERDVKGVVIMRHISVAGHLTVRVHTAKGDREITKSGFGSQQWLPTMEFGDALKAARSDLIKTCAFQLGIALDLYWNERAELDEFVVKETAKNESARIAEQLTTGIPSTPIMLLSRAMSDLQFDGMKVAELCDTTIDLLMDADEKMIAKYWKVIKDAKEKG